MIFLFYKNQALMFCKYEPRTIDIFEVSKIMLYFSVSKYVPKNGGRKAYFER